MAKGRKTRGETPRRKAGAIAKAGRRHVPNPNHPGPRPEEQVKQQMKGTK